MIYGEQTYHVLRDITDLIGIRTLLIRRYWQAEGNVRTQEDLDAQKPGVPSVPGGVLLMGEQTLKERGRFATIWTFQGINGDGKGVTFKRRGGSWDYGFEPGFAQVPIQLHKDFDALREQYGGYPSNDGASVIWPPELEAGGSKSGTSKSEKSGAGSLNPMFGIQAYFEMEGVYRYRYAERTPPKQLFDGVGFIADKLPGDPPIVSDGRNWLMAPPQWDRKGVVIDITEYYWLSRRGGWPVPVYGGSKKQGLSGGGLTTSSVGAAGT